MPFGESDDVPKCIKRSKKTSDDAGYRVFPMALFFVYDLSTSKSLLSCIYTASLGIGEREAR